ncbi:myb-like protein B [Gossypium australe]|uniref:Myb-like protein B n=1 Tax=Gossypium australe TaxID=47621 RepID=A0A5B6UFV7_9ROSI|nr:myb-like protein B [Gossypium australe]
MKDGSLGLQISLRVMLEWDPDFLCSRTLWHLGCRKLMRTWDITSSHLGELMIEWLLKVVMGADIEVEDIWFTNNECPSLVKETC